MTPRLSVIGASIKKLFDAIGGAGDLYWDSVVAAMKMEDKDDPLWKKTVLAMPMDTPDPHWSSTTLALRFDEGESYWSSTASLLHFDGVNDGTVFTDDKSKVWTRSGFVVTKTTTSQYGGASGYFPNGSYLSTPAHADFNFGSGPFTLEMSINWVTVPGGSGDPCVLIRKSDLASQRSFLWDIYYEGSGIWSMRFSISTTGSSDAVTHSVQISTPATGQWYRYAVSKVDNTLRFFINGTVVGTFTDTNAIFNSTVGVRIGTTGGNAEAYVDELRITKAGRYAANYTPATSAFTGSGFVDLKGRSVNGVGGVVRDTSVKVFGDGAAAFDGTSGYLAAADSTDWNLGSGDFTIETWFRTSDVAANQTIIGHLDLQATPFKGWVLRYDPTLVPAGLRFVAFTGNADNHSDELQAPWAPVANTWYHIAVVRSGNTLAILANGRQVGARLMQLATTISAATGRSLMIGAQDSAATPSLFLNGYLDDLRITKGAARYPIQQITGDPHWASVSMLMHMDGVNNGTTFTEAKGKTITRVGDTKTVTVARKLGTASAYFDGTGDYLSTTSSPDDFRFGSGDYTVEAWIYPMSTASLQDIVFFGVDYTDCWFMRYYGNGRIGHSLYNGTTQQSLSGGAGLAPVGVWSHVAIAKQGTTVRAFINGASVATATFSLAQGPVTGTPTLRVGIDSSGTTPFTGFIDELRVTKGVARYVEKFAPPYYAGPEAVGNAEYPYNTLVYSPSRLPFMTPVNGNFIDLIGKVSTVAGTPSLNTTTKKFGHSSAQFNGTTDYLSLASHADFGFGTGDFTAELWINTVATDGVILDLRSALTDQHSTLAVSGGRLAIWNGANWLRGATSVNTSAWWHVAVVRYRDVITVYLNGLIEMYLPSTVDLGSTRPARLAAAFDGTNFYAGHIDDLRIIKGAARYAGEFTPAAYPFMHPGNRPLFLEEKALSTLPVSNTTTGPGRFGTAAYFDGAVDSIQISGAPLLPATGDWTIECWIYRDVAGVAHQVYSQGSPAIAGRTFFLVEASNQLNFFVGSTTNLNIFSTATIAAQVWTHVAVVRAGDTYTMYINGVADGVGTSAQAIDQTSLNLIGRNQSDILPRFFNGYIDDLRITKVARYAGNFTPPSKTIPTYGQQNVDPHFNNVVLLMHMDGSDNGTTFTDVTGKVVTATNAVTKSAVKKFGTASAYFDGAGDYLTVSNATDYSLIMGTSDFTIELWASFSYATQPLAFAQILCKGDETTSGFVLFTRKASGLSTFRFGGDTTNDLNFASVDGGWHHYAICRSGTTWRSFLDGVLQTERSGLSFSLSNSTLALTIGATGASPTNFYNGYIDELRITKGVARYTENFQPIQLPFPEKAFDPLPVVADPHLNNVVLGMHMDGANDGTVFTDMTGKTVTQTGAVTKTAVKRFGTASAYFDGVDDYLTVPYTADFNFGTGDFTAECWVKPSVLPASGAQVFLFGRYVNFRSWAIFLYNNSGTQEIRSFMCSDGLNNASSSIATAQVTLSTWNWTHLAMVRHAGKHYLFVNGVKYTAPVDANYDLYDNGVAIGIGARADAVSFLNGYIDDVRITKGVARYTDNFTPPGAFPEVLPTV